MCFRNWRRPDTTAPAVDNPLNESQTFQNLQRCFVSAGCCFCTALVSVPQLLWLLRVTACMSTLSFIGLPAPKPTPSAAPSRQHYTL